MPPSPYGELVAARKENSDGRWAVKNPVLCKRLSKYQGPTRSLAFDAKLLESTHLNRF